MATASARHLVALLLLDKSPESSLEVENGDLVGALSVAKAAKHDHEPVNLVHDGCVLVTEPHRISLGLQHLPAKRPHVDQVQWRRIGGCSILTAANACLLRRQLLSLHFALVVRILSVVISSEQVHEVAVDDTRVVSDASWLVMRGSRRLDQLPAATELALVLLSIHILHGLEVELPQARHRAIADVCASEHIQPLVVNETAVIAATLRRGALHAQLIPVLREVVLEGGRHELGKCGLVLLTERCLVGHGVGGRLTVARHVWQVVVALVGLVAARLSRHRLLHLIYRRVLQLVRLF